MQVRFRDRESREQKQPNRGYIAGINQQIQTQNTIKGEQILRTTRAAARPCHFPMLLMTALSISWWIVHAVVRVSGRVLNDWTS